MTHVHDVPSLARPPLVFPLYVKDNQPAAWTKDGVYLWHKVSKLTRSPGNEAVYAGCGHKISRPEGLPFTQLGDIFELIYEEMTFKSWDDRFGEDVDLCQCAVSSRKDVEQVLDFMKETTDGEH